MQQLKVRKPVNGVAGLLAMESQFSLGGLVRQSHSFLWWEGQTSGGSGETLLSVQCLSSV